MSSFCNAKATNNFSAKNINVFAVFQDKKISLMLTNNDKFWTTGPSIKKAEQGIRSGHPSVSLM